MLRVILDLDSINQLSHRLVTTGYEPGRDHDPDTIFDHYQAIIVESRTFKRARPQGPGRIANASGVRTPYRLRKTIQQCKRCLLSTKSQTQPLRWPAMAVMAAMAAMAAMAWMATVLSPTGIRDYGNRTIRQRDTFGTSTESGLAGLCVSIMSTPSEDIVSHPEMSLGQHRVNTLGGHRVNTLGGHRVNTLGGTRVTTLG